MLVIILVVIIIVASIAIYFLLRNGEPSAAERAARRKYSIRRRGMRVHPLPIGLPGSLSEKIGSMFKGRRAGAGAGWVPASDEMEEWDSTDEPLRERERDEDHLHPHHHRDVVVHEQEVDGFPRVGSAPVSRRATLTEASESAHASRTASHVDSVGFESDDPPPDLHVQAPSVPTPEPDEEWLNSGDNRNGLGGGGVGGGGTSLSYFAPQPRRANSGHDIPLFAGSTPPFQFQRNI
ncbi:hypothetical protein B0F90DRAFT_1363244 [Multifurca ochricompacta]|uniref:Uncharacterized protein n=1 Tax=Multifurca ochricompacta TaxID=376703 RepID=A0AAD4M5N3_9AGAM|nr:hypothetical protein B0F90DRAFT_1363244 [Multifurca ochricompacta]